MRKAILLPVTSHIVRVTQETRTVKTFVLDAAVQAEPGQFLMVWLPGVGEKPISIMEPNPLSLTVARVGPFSAALHTRKPGDLVAWRGPFGRPFALRGRKILLVAGGYGSAPLYFLAVRACQAGLQTLVAIGARSADELVLVERFRELGCATIIATDRGDLGHKGFVTEAILDILPECDCVYACGPEPMLVAIAQLCWQAGVPAQVSVERYMKCGFGLCGQCALDDKLVCQDGPVFDIEELRHSEDFGRYTRNATGRRVPL